MSKSILQTEKGLTLIEILLAITIFSIVILSVSGFFLQSSKVSSANNQKLEAVNLARKHLEETVHQKDKSFILNGSCSSIPNDSPSNVKWCSQIASLNTTYTIWKFVKEADTFAYSDEKFYPITIRVYFNNDYVETYGYYHSK